MIHSMTGYAAASLDTEQGKLTLELRSVNSRFLDLQFRIGDELRPLEPRLREAITARVARGKVDCRLFINHGAAQPLEHALNEAVLAELSRLSDEVRHAMPEAGPLRVADILRWPGALAERSLDEDAMQRAVESVCDTALKDFAAAREREGARLAAAITERVAAMRAHLDALAPLVPQAIAAYRDRLAERLREALGNADDDRVRTEVAMFAAKSDVDEELTRLASHLTEVERTLAKGGQAGKRLDFLAQELNREANTLASKAASQAVSDCALELKLLIEQIREQVQNIE